MTISYKIFDIENGQRYTSLRKYFIENRHRLGVVICQEIKKDVDAARQKSFPAGTEYGVILTAPKKLNGPCGVQVMKQEDAQNLYLKSLQDILNITPSAPEKSRRKRIPLTANFK